MTDYCEPFGNFLRAQRESPDKVSSILQSLVKSRGKVDAPASALTVLFVASTPTALPEGGSVCIIGSTSELGLWKIDAAVKMKCVDREGMVHVAAIPFDTVDVTKCEYKYVLQQDGVEVSGYGENDEEIKRTVSHIAWETTKGNRTANALAIAGATSMGVRFDYPVPFCWYPGTIRFQIHYNLGEHERMAVTGDPAAIGAWIHPGPIRMRLSDEELPLQKEIGGTGHFWQFEIPKPPVKKFDYRYIIIDTNTGGQRWEREPNRTCVIEVGDGPDHVQVLNDVNFVSAMEFNKIPFNKNTTFFIGPYPQSEEDLDAIKAAGGTAVVNVQTDEDFLHRKIDWERLTKHYEYHKNIDRILKQCRFNNIYIFFELFSGRQVSSFDGPLFKTSTRIT
mmetsp:Transcript_7051/g.18308  ORF Transcript_7051/g.18308 Transcript_7051/m.18308 type:complete len:392 (-) Transcript_7051:1475-2650(-)